MTHRVFSKWVTCPRPDSSAKLRLFCLPFAGGGASIYRTWPAALPSWVEVCPIQLPGREERYRETPFTSLTGMSRALARELLPYLDKPYAVFGHSMGALLGFETARALRHVPARPPLALFPAAYDAPDAPLTGAPIHQLPDREFVAEMRRRQGPSAVLDNAELMDFVLPILRADFEACDTYAFAAEPPLDCPFFVYGGEADEEVDRRALERWREATTGGFTLTMMPGTHFFVQSHRDLLLRDIARQLVTLPV
jgi:medium-chain acyl-[acyl-carrier-protein] hydrolase